PWMPDDSFHRIAGEIRFLANTPELLWTEKSYPACEAARCVVGAGKDRIGPIHGGIHSWPKPVRCVLHVRPGWHVALKEARLIPARVDIERTRPRAGPTRRILWRAERRRVWKRRAVDGQAKAWNELGFTNAKPGHTVIDRNAEHASPPQSADDMIDSSEDEVEERIVTRD